MKASLTLSAGWMIVFCWVVLGMGTPYAWGEDVREVKFDALTLKVPVNWKQQTPSNKLRLGQIAIPAAEGDPEPAELNVFNFGFGGGTKENVDRWLLQFEPADRKSKITAGRSAQGQYVFVDVSGTFKKPVGNPAQQRTERASGYRMLGVILAIDNKSNYFLKLTGPEKTVASAADGLRSSFGGKASEEKPYDPDKPE